MSPANISYHNAWVGLGSLVGFCAGALQNFSTTRSVKASPEKPIGFDSKEHREQNRINSIRERILYSGCPTELLTFVPATAFAVWNIFSESSKIKSEILSHIFYPLAAYLCSSVVGGQLLRPRLQKILPSLDISGHALRQVVNHIFTAHVLKSFDDHNHSIQSAALCALVGLASITDAIFMYNTTAYTHSILDVVTGAALPIFGYTVFRSAEFVYDGL